MLRMTYVLLTLRQHPVVDICRRVECLSPWRRDWEVQVVQHGARSTGKYPNATPFDSRLYRTNVCS